MNIGVWRRKSIRIEPFSSVINRLTCHIKHYRGERPLKISSTTAQTEINTKRDATTTTTTKKKDAGKQREGEGKKRRNRKRHSTEGLGHEATNLLTQRLIGSPLVLLALSAGQVKESRRVYGSLLSRLKDRTKRRRRDKRSLETIRTLVPSTLIIL